MMRNFQFRTISSDMSRDSFPFKITNTNWWRSMKTRVPREDATCSQRDRGLPPTLFYLQVVRLPLRSPYFELFDL